MRKTTLYLALSVFVFPLFANGASMDSYPEQVTPATASDFLFTWDDSSALGSAKILFPGTSDKYLSGLGTWLDVVAGVSTSAEVIAVFDSGSCDGYLKSDGSCDTPSGTGGEANVNADWDATNGDALILNKPTIPTNNTELTNGASYLTETAANAFYSVLAHNHSGVYEPAGVTVSDISDAGSAISRAAEDTLTNGANLPDGAAIITYGNANWSGSGTIDTVITDGSTNAVTNNAVFDALELKANDSEVVKVADGTEASTIGEALVTAATETAAQQAMGVEIDSDIPSYSHFANQTAFESEFFALPSGSTGVLSTVVNSDETCNPGQIYRTSANDRLVLCVSSGNLDTVATPTDWDNPTTTTYTLDLTLVDLDGDSVNSVSVAGPTDITGLSSASYALTETFGSTNDTVVCTGSAVTGSANNYVVDMSDSDESATCTFSASAFACSSSPSYEYTTTTGNWISVGTDQYTAQLGGVQWDGTTTTVCGVDLYMRSQGDVSGVSYVVDIYTLDGSDIVDTLIATSSPVSGSSISTGWVNFAFDAGYPLATNSIAIVRRTDPDTIDGTNFVQVNFTYNSGTDMNSGAGAFAYAISFSDYQAALRLYSPE